MAVDRASAQSKAAHDGGAAPIVAAAAQQDGGLLVIRVARLCLWDMYVYHFFPGDTYDRLCFLATYIPTEGKGEEAAGEGDFDPVIAGPWMLRWDIGKCRGPFIFVTWLCVGVGRSILSSSPTSFWF